MRRAVAAAVAVALTVGSAACSGGEGREPTPEEAVPPGAPAPPSEATRREAGLFDRQAKAAFEGFEPAYRRLIAGAQEWMAGRRDAGVFGVDVDAAEAAFAATRDRIERLPRPSFAPDVNDLYGASARLYLEVARVYGVTISTDPLAPDLRGQLHALGQRLRLLGDRTFDRGRTLLEPHLGEERSDDVDVRFPPEVPDWASERIAAGPPLDDAPSGPPGPAPVRDENRRQQPLRAWRDALEELNVGDAAVLVAAIDGRDQAVLRAEARRLVAASDALRDEADPEGGGRELSARTRLALLIHADAARAAQAASLLADPGQADLLASVARRVAAAGDLVWPVDAGIRSSGFPADAEEGA